MLSIHYDKEGEEYDSTIQKKVSDYCAGLIDYVGFDDFAVKSTRRQFIRYKLYWGDTEGGRLGKIAGEIVNALTPDE